MNTDSGREAPVFWGAGTSRTMRPIWVAEELGLTYTLQAIGPRTGETQTVEYTRLNPKQKVPFLVDNGLELSESIAICRYLVRQYGADSILRSPTDIKEQAREDEWLSFVYGEIDETSLYVIRRHGQLASIYGEAPAAITAAKEYVKRQLVVVQEQLEHNSYLLGEDFSLPDIFLKTCLDWAHISGIDLPEVLHLYRDHLAQRPAYQRARKANHPDK